MTRKFKMLADIATYRGAMKRDLMKIGYHFCGGETTAQLEEMMRINNLEICEE